MSNMKRENVRHGEYNMRASVKSCFTQQKGNRDRKGKGALKTD
jgi:hypothetical protein